MTGPQLRLRNEYGAWALWEVGGPISENIDARSLPIGAELADRIDAWSRRYDDTMDDEYPPWSGFASRRDRDDFIVEGESIVSALRSAMPDADVALDLGPLPLASERRPGPGPG